MLTGEERGEDEGDKEGADSREERKREGRAEIARTAIPQHLSPKKKISHGE